MAEEGSEGSVATSSSTPNWWELHANSMSSWGAINAWHPPTHNSSSCEEDISISNSFTNASNQSGLSMDESASAVTELSGEPTSNNHLWRQVLLSVGSGGESNNGQYDDGGSLLKGFSCKNPTMELLEPDLKKLDNCWEFANPVASFNSMEKQLNSYDGSLMENERLTNLSDMVNNWSIAPPDQHAATTPVFLSNGGLGSRNSSCMPCYGHEMKVESGQQHGAMQASDEGAFLRPCNGNSMEYQMTHNQTLTGDNSSKYHYGMLPDVPWSNSRAFSDFISFGGCLNKPLVDFHTTKNCTRASNPPDHSKKQGHDQTSSTRGIGRGVGSSNEGKKKRSEENSDTAGFKKPKNDNSTASSMKIQAPKVKLADKISALQQIVSPFGKTDTASVLFEAIGYIKFLQEQVQLLSNPYMKPSFSKDHSPWGGLERKDKSEIKHDLKSRGLCLVPISCTPQVYRENNGSDYWTPAYRGCLYR